MNLTGTSKNIYSDPVRIYKTVNHSIQPSVAKNSYFSDVVHLLAETKIG